LELLLLRKVLVDLTDLCACDSLTFQGDLTVALPWYSFLC
jgi:hypothetical protein